MDLSEVAELVFDHDKAGPIFPRPVVKTAQLVRLPRVGEQKVPISIQPEWGGVQTFLNDFYLVQGEDGTYGSAGHQWLAMHTLIIGETLWVKTTVPMAYVTDATVRIVTLLPDPEDSSRVVEANQIAIPGDWIVCQPGGEIQPIKAVKYPKIYFSHDEAVSLGLPDMTLDQFTAWAIEQARMSLVS